jgi:2-methylcitrate dehydratase PrpD
MMETLLDLTEWSDLPDSARAMARLSLFDWMVCGLAGVGEPVSAILRAHAAGSGAATVFGGGTAPARAAALANGTISHALDYDDTHFGHIGHLSVGIYPAALAVGQEVGADTAAVVDAFLVGAEAAIRLGMVLGVGHYNRGFHQTATAGAFGATIAAGRLYGLTRGQMRAALGLCATRASGLKSQFGTMGKPLNAGIAASNGVECAALALAGMTSASDGIWGPQGFVATHSDAPMPWDDRAAFLFEDVQYKLHACCHGTHAMIEALGAVKRQHNLPAERVAAIRLRTSPRWLSVCDIKTPRTGLEVKFSYAWLAGMVLSGIATSSDRSYTDALAQDAALTDFAQRITVTGDAAVGDMQALGQVETVDGQIIPFAHDLAARQPLDQLQAALRAKADGLIGVERAGQLWAGAQTAQDLGRMMQA